MISRFTWQLKAVLPVAFVLFNGLLLFLLVTISVASAERHTILLVAGAGAVAICAALLIALTLVVGRPMLELQQKIAQVRDGDLNVTVDFASRNDAIGDLGKDFNNMVRELRESREEIQRLHKSQMSRAEHLATLGELAAGLAHEIRNPLACIAGVMNVIESELPPHSAAREVLPEVKSEVQDINSILSDLLDTARPTPPQFRIGDLNATVEHAVLFARQQVLSKPIEIQLVKDEELPVIEHDAGQMHRVLLNLLLNAIQAIKGPGRITAKVAKRDEYAMIRIEDTGGGIPMDHLNSIFRPFYTTKGNGTGLGLSMAKRMIEEHGGRIEVSSEVGRGTVFRVLLPLQRTSVEMARA